MEFLEFDSFLNLPSSQSVVSGSSPNSDCAMGSTGSSQKFSEVILLASQQQQQDNQSWTTDCSLPQDIEPIGYTPNSASALSPAVAVAAITALAAFDSSPTITFEQHNQHHRFLQQQNKESKKSKQQPLFNYSDHEKSNKTCYENNNNDNTTQFTFTPKRTQQDKKSSTISLEQSEQQYLQNRITFESIFYQQHTHSPSAENFQLVPTSLTETLKKNTDSPSIAGTPSRYICKSSHQQRTPQKQAITDRFVPSRCESKFATYSAYESQCFDENSCGNYGTSSNSGLNGNSGNPTNTGTNNNNNNNNMNNPNNSNNNNNLNSDVRFKNAVDKDEMNQISISQLYKSHVLGIRDRKKEILANSLSSYSTSSAMHAFHSFENQNVLRYCRQIDVGDQLVGSMHGYSHQSSSQSSQQHSQHFRSNQLEFTESHFEESFGYARKIPKVPMKVLDAPALQDDFYLNLIDWSNSNVLAVGLSSCVYLWSACSSRVTKLCDFTRVNEVTSVSWSLDQPLLSIGKNSGEVEIWDSVKQEKVRVLTGHSQRVGTLAWGQNLLSSGSRDKSILQRDLRTKRHFEQKLTGHKQEVCGLKWSFDDQQLASGGNDNKLFIWNARSSRPVERFGNHNAAVKALAWSPHQHGLLVSGGGTQDRTIRFWNTLTSKQLECIETGSQVCNLIFSKNANELVSTHGYSQNQVIVWNYPDMEKLATLTGHQSRVLYLAISPDGSTIVTGAGDETLRFWNVFPPNPANLTNARESLLAEENYSKISCIR